jgi:hypothetical protein
MLTQLADGWLTLRGGQEFVIWFGHGADLFCLYQVKFFHRISGISSGSRRFRQNQACLYQTSEHAVGFTWLAFNPERLLFKHL